MSAAAAKQQIRSEAQKEARRLRDAEAGRGTGRTKGEASAARHAAKQAADEAAAAAKARAVGYEPNGDVEWVPVSLMFVDLTTPTKNGLPYGREPKRQQVMKMALDFNPDALGVVYLSYRESGPYAGRYAILDGGHRHALMQAIGWGDQALPAFVYRGLTIEQEADLFVRMNRDRRAPTPIVIFKSQVAAGDPESVAIYKTLTHLGLTIGHTQTPSTIQAIGTLQTVYRQVGAPITRKVLRTLHEAWPKDRMAFNGTLMEGAAFLFWAVPSIREDDLAERLASKLPTEVISRARLVREVDTDHTGYSAGAKAILDAYNERRRNGRLPMFTQRSWPRATTHSGIGDVRRGTGRLPRK